MEITAAISLILALSNLEGQQTARDPASVASPLYRLAPDDKLRIRVYNEEGLSGTFTVSSDGTVSFPVLGALKVGGLTPSELQLLLTARLSAQVVKDAKVSVDLDEYRPFFILGEVNHSGQFPYRVGLTLNAAVATAGGFTYRANHKFVAIQHLNQPNEERVRIRPGLQILPGDTVRVLERFF